MVFPKNTPPTTAVAFSRGAPASGTEIAVDGGDGQIAARPEPDGPVRSFAIYKWTSLGLGALGLAVRSYALLSRNSSASSFNSEGSDGRKVCFESQGKVLGPNGEAPSDRCTDLKLEVESMTTIATAGFVAGFSFVALGAVLWALEGPRGSQTSQALSCAPALSQLGLACAGRF